IAFVVDIRRQNAIEHLFYKALFELSNDRADFVSRLFARRRPPGLNNASTAPLLFAAYDTVAADSALYRGTVAAAESVLVRKHGFALSDDDRKSLHYVASAFYNGGTRLSYFMSGGFGRGGGWRGMPTYADLMVADDGHGANRSYLATEE